MKDKGKFSIVKLAIVLFIIYLAALFSSCDNVLALGDIVNLKGPDLVIDPDWPLSRQPVAGTFLMKGTVKDKTGISRIVVKTGDDTYRKQWRWTFNGPVDSQGWEVSMDAGLNWAPLEAVEIVPGDPTSSETPKWSGDRETIFSWELPIDLAMSPGNLPPDGQYQFSVTAWNPAGNSDSNSFKTRTVLLSSDPPLISIITPYLYQNKNNELTTPGKELNTLDTMADTAANRQNSLYLGKFLNRTVNLQWVINSPNDVWSMDIRLYKESDDWESLPNSYVYRINNVLDSDTRPPSLDPNDAVKYNGKVVIPDLSQGLVSGFVPKDPETGQGG